MTTYHDPWAKDPMSFCEWDTTPESDPVYVPCGAPSFTTNYIELETHEPKLCPKHTLAAMFMIMPELGN